MRVRLLALPLTGLVLAACGSSGDSGGDGSTAAAAGTSTATSIVVAVKPPATGAAPWPAPPDPMGLAAKAGLAGEPVERLQYHVHSHLDVFINGQRTEVPA